VIKASANNEIGEYKDKTSILDLLQEEEEILVFQEGDD
jgi:hypothetical protein